MRYFASKIDGIYLSNFLKKEKAERGKRILLRLDGLGWLVLYLYLYTAVFLVTHQNKSF